MKMADNYYTILSNRVPEVWFDQGVELGGGQPFTVGVEGDERNDRHVVSLIMIYKFHSVVWTSFLTKIFFYFFSAAGDSVPGFYHFDQIFQLASRAAIRSRVGGGP